MNVDVMGTVLSASLYMVLQWNDYKNMSIIVLIVLLLFATRIIIELWKRNRILKDNRDDEIYDRIKAIAINQAGRDADLARLAQQQDMLMNEHVRTSGVDRRILAVCIGKDSALAQDLVAIRQSWEPGNYINITPLTKEQFINSVVRYRVGRRKSDRSIRYIHFAVHSGRDGLLFDDGTVGTVFLSDYLVDVECIFINGCNSDTIADGLVGLARYVVSLSDEVEHQAATRLCRAFWGYVRDGISIEDAYYRSINEAPRSVSECAVLLQRD